MPFNGAGVYTVPVVMVADAASGVKILASRQDTNWNDVAAALSLCLTRDSQGKPSQDWDANAHKVINLAPATAPADAVPLSQINLLASDWIFETNNVIIQSSNQFKVLGIDRTATYQPGRRVRINHNSGGTTTYGTVFSSSFAVDTLVSVTLDTGILSPTITGVYYGIIAPGNRSSLPTKSAVLVTMTGGGALTSGAIYILGAAAPFATTSVVADVLGEMAAGVFTAKQPGLYAVDCQINTLRNGSTVTADGQFGVYVNGAAVYGPGAFLSNYSSIQQSTGTFNTLVYMNAGDQLTVRTLNPIGFTGGPQSVGNCFIRVMRVG